MVKWEYLEIILALGTCLVASDKALICFSSVCKARNRVKDCSDLI